VWLIIGVSNSIFLSKFVGSGNDALKFCFMKFIKNN
jgi:hypothetical protein